MTEVVDGLRHSSAGRIRRGHVHVDLDAVASERRQGRSGLGAVDVGDGDAGTLGGERAADGGADAASATRYESGLAVESVTHLTFVSFLAHAGRLQDK